MNGAQILEKIKIHKAACMLALITGLIVVAPYFFTICTLGYRYSGYYPLAADAETHYLARINNFANRQSVGNPYLYELRNEPSPFFTLSEPLLSLPVIIFGVSVSNLNLVYKFILPIIAFWALYLLLFELFDDKWWSAVTSFFIIIAGPLLNLADIKALLTWDYTYWGFLQFARPVNPQLSATLFFLFLYLLFLYIKNPTRKKTVMLGLFWGLLIYIYLYSFLFVSALMFSFLILSYFRERKIFTDIFLAGVISLAVSSFGLLNLYILTHHQWYALLAAQNGLRFARLPIISYGGLIITVILFSTLYKKIIDWLEPAGFFLVTCVVTSWIVINQQIITGNELQSGHFHWYFNVPIYAITLFFCLYRWLSHLRLEQIKKYVIFVVLLVTIFFGYLVQASSYSKNFKTTAEAERLIPALNWLSKNTFKNDVILSNNFIADLVPIFSKNYTAWSNHAITYIIDPKRLIYNSPLKILESLDIFKKQYKIDYIIWDKKVNPDWKACNLDFFKKVVEINSIAIYKLD